MALHDGPDHFDESDLPDEDTLRELYIDEGLTRQQVADKLGVSIHAVRQAIQTYDVYKQDGHGPTVGPASWLAEIGEQNDQGGNDE